MGDLHGEKPNFHYEDFDAIIAPGDFCSSNFRDKVFEAMERRNEGEDIQWYDIVGRDEAEEWVEESIEDGREVLEFLNDQGVPVYVVPGNWDWLPQDSDWDFLQKNHYKEELLEGLDNVVDLHEWIAESNGFNLIGMGGSSGPEYPQSKDKMEGYDLQELERVKEEFDDDYKRVGSLLAQATKPAILITHNVPYDTPLDVVGMEDSPHEGEHIGSVIAQKLVKEYQPLVCIGAHVHEHFGKAEMGDTTVINAGFGPDKNTLLEVEDSDIVKLEFQAE